jgi:hypothetical protein
MLLGVGRCGATARTGALAALILGVVGGAAAWAAGRDEAIVHHPIHAPLSAEAGAWRSKVQPVFDPVQHMLVRRLYTVWDAMPSRDLDFTWAPQSPRDDKDGKIRGVGTLIWRLKNLPAYDPASVFAKYRGAMQGGRAEGEGRYFDRTGVTYAGAWKAGLMDGFGRLTLPNGDEYDGRMRAGKADGVGRYTDATGESFEGKFIDGERDGVGTTMLPNGNTYRSIWTMGKETADSRQLRLAQAGGQFVPGGANDIRIGISIDKSKAQDGDNDLTYTALSDGARLIIQPDSKRLMTMWKGNGEIELQRGEEGEPPQYGVFSLNKGQLIPLTFSLQLENRSAVPIQVTGAYLAVDSSVSDLEPAIQLNRALEVCHEEPFKPSFRAENFGWGAAQNATLHFRFVNPNVSTRPGNGGVSKDIGNIARVTEINLEPQLRAAGVNTRLLAAKSQSGFVCSRGTSPEACLQQIKSSGVFGSLTSAVASSGGTGILIAVAGTLDYSWIDSRGARQTRSSPYRLDLPLGHIKIEAECGEGGAPEQIAANALQFKLDQTGYRLPISFQRSIPAGRTSQFLISVKADKSSEHNFTVVLQLADGREISSRPISLIYYWPSWFPPS